MLPEDGIQKFLEEECFTTPEEKDPCKPIILDDGFVKPNPDFDPELLAREARANEIERRREHLGTSFFLNFDPLCNLHQIGGPIGNDVRLAIVSSLADRFVSVFADQFPNSQPPIDSLYSMLRISVCPWSQPGFNNGEVYIWLPGIPLKEDFVFTMLRAFRNSLENDPISVSVEEKDYKVQFYGWGFRYY